MICISATAALYYKMYLFGMTLVIWSFVIYVSSYKLYGLLSKLLAFLMRNYFPKQPSGAPLHTLSNYMMFPLVL